MAARRLLTNSLVGVQRGRSSPGVIVKPESSLHYGDCKSRSLRSGESAKWQPVMVGIGETSTYSDESALLYSLISPDARRLV